MTLDVTNERKNSRKFGKVDFAQRRYSNPNDTNNNNIGSDPAFDEHNIVIANRPNTSKNNAELGGNSSLSKSFNKRLLGV